MNKVILRKLPIDPKKPPQIWVGMRKTMGVILRKLAKHEPRGDA